MTIPEILTLLAAGTGAVVTIINAIKGHRRGTTARTAMSTLGGRVNGRLEELLATTRESARLEGYAAGLREQLRHEPRPKTKRRRSPLDELRMEDD